MKEKSDIRECPVCGCMITKKIKRRRACDLNKCVRCGHEWPFGLLDNN